MKAIRSSCLIHLVYLAAALLFLNTTGAAAVALANGSFEILENTSGGGPTSFGDWNADLTQIVVGTQSDGITPFHGNQMLRFDGTLPGGGAIGMASEIVQLIDVSALGSQIAAGLVSVSAFAHFNRVAGDSSTDTRFDVNLLAHSGIPADFQTNMPIGLPAQSSILTDSDPNSWEVLSASLLLPTGTAYLQLRLDAHENIVNDNVSPEFAGHYVDNALLTTTIVPEPSLSALLAVTALWFVGVSRRRKDISTTT